ncbi:MAG: DUF3108 domain-containing protein [Candidatus Omnitrophica bacterium]|nr:DUF3108 domain-containing protein [Candidatus Omnitrophota bacterium]
MTGFDVIRRFFGVFFFLILFLASSAQAGELPFEPGERILYNIKQFGVKVGDADLKFAGTKKLSDGRDASLIIFTSHAPNFFDEEKIYVNPSNFSPLRVERNLNIWGKKEKITEEYLTAEGKIKIAKISNGTTTEQVLVKKGVIDNIYGFIYRYRSQGKFDAGEQFSVNLPTKDVVIKIADEMSFNADGKTYQAILMTSVPSRYSIWMDKSEKRLPLRISGAVGLANTVMTMVGVEEDKNQ